ncbi:MAG: hypothetical protein AAGG11_09300 [Pseudomonadota bacterium]
MLNFPVRSALQELEVALVCIEREPTPFAARPRDFLMGITDVFEVERPMFVGLISQMLRLAGDGVDLTTRSANLLDNAVVPVAP